MHDTHARLLSLTTLTLVCAAPAAADTVRLRQSVRLDVDADAVRLADIAELDGDEASRHADLVVASAPDADRPLELTIADVRDRLSEAGVHWGRVNLSGARVTVEPTVRRADQPVAMRGATLASATRHRAATRTPDDDHIARDIVAETTARGAIARELLPALGVDPDDLRVQVSPDHRDLLDRAWADPDLGRAIELAAEASLRSDRVTFVVRLWSQGRVATHGRVTVRPLVRTPVAILHRDIERGETILPADVERTARWLAPLQAALACPPADATARVATRSLTAGEVVRVRHVEPPTVIRRGDRVNVHCLVGGIVIALRAEARQDGAVGDEIEMRKLGERRTFTATVLGSGEAVVDLTGSARTDVPDALTRRND